MKTIWKPIMLPDKLDSYFPCSNTYRDMIFISAQKTFICKKCDKLFGNFDYNKPMAFTNARCQCCSADISGKIYPKERETPRIQKTYNIPQNEIYDNIIIKLIYDNKKAAEEVCYNLEKVGFFVGLAKKLIPENGGVLRERILRLINSSKEI